MNTTPGTFLPGVRLPDSQGTQGNRHAPSVATSGVCQFLRGPRETGTKAGDPQAPAVCTCSVSSSASCSVSPADPADETEHEAELLTEQVQTAGA